MTKKNETIVNVNNQVANLEQGMTASRSTKNATSTLNQARKSLGGIQNEPITIGRDEQKKKVYSTVGSFMETMGCPYVNGQVTLAAIKAAVHDYLCGKEGELQVCKNVVQRTKVGKQSYVLYRKNEKGEFKAVTIYQPAPVREQGWSPYLICVLLAQSHFIEETIAACDASKAEFERLRDAGELYVHDELTDSYVSIALREAA